MTDLTTTGLDAAARVARGAALLDRLRPDWADIVNTDRLTMTDGHYCIVGQLYDGYWEGLEQIFCLAPIGAREAGMLSAQAQAHGFQARCAPDQASCSDPECSAWYCSAERQRFDQHDYPLLRDAWLAQIGARRVS
jgi:hypothetical protein